VKRIVALTLASAALATAHAAPLIIYETQTLDVPAPYQYKAVTGVEVDGDHLLMRATRDEVPAIFAFDRGADGLWHYTQTLAEAADVQGYGFGLSGNVAATGLTGIRIFQRGAAGWALATYTGTNYPSGYEISGDNLFASAANCVIQTIRRQGPTSWVEAGALPVTNPDCEVRAVSADGDRVLAASEVPRASGVGGEVVLQLFRRASTGAWQPGPALVPPAGVELLTNDAPLRGARAAATALPEDGGDVVWGESSGAWTVRGRLQSPDAFQSMNGSATRVVRISGDLFLQQGTHQREEFAGSGVIRVFREIDGAFEHVATLRPRINYPLSGPMTVSGRHVLVAAGNDQTVPWDRVYAFELPESLPVPAAPIVENFESGSAAAWRTSGGQYSVVAIGNTRMYRQAITAGSTGAELMSVSLGNQVIEADVLTTEFAAAGRWVGLMTRRTDSRNYYYATLQTPGAVSFRRARNGVNTTLATWTQSVPAVIPGQRYRMRLESIGDRHVVYVNNRLIGAVTDATLAEGRAGIVMYQASANFDNVVVTPNGHNVLRDQLFEHLHSEHGDRLWSQDLSPNWVLGDFGESYTQTSLAGYARNLTGVPTDDQLVSVDVRANQFGPSSQTDFPWIGLIARYVDDGNHYYVSLRDSNLIMLRKRVNNTIVGLGSVAYNVAPGTTYNVRLEAIGNWLRVYVNGRMMLEKVDASHPVGTYGLATYKTQAQFTNFVVEEP
jgi:hypothetical protein